mmetsp:Transcript_21534/g.44354  ORF Transcript_21534/g.44354 Transcript_21534/m.44354 type:complete len:149 (-) Transcript_21534:1705-2151(-)
MAALQDFQCQSNPNLTNPPRRRRQRRISSGIDSCCSGGSGTSSGKKLTRRLSRRLSGVFARSSSQDSSNANIAKAARRDSLTDVRDKIASGEATYTPRSQHPMLKSYLIYNEAEDDGDFADEECKEKYDTATSRSHQAAANVKTSRAA